MGMLGTCYLLHINGSYKHAGHYLGWCKSGDPTDRVDTHLTGNGSPLIKAALAAGCTVTLVRTWDNVTRDYERQLKDRHNARGLCPVCKALHNERARINMAALRRRRAVTL